MATRPIIPKNAWRMLRPLAVVGGALAILFSVAYWGGAARINGLFFAGVAALSGLILAFGLLAWWLYLSPAPAGQGQRSRESSAAARQAVGLLAMAGGLLFVIGAAWDEAWHRIYGVGGALNDFLWAPHKLLYGSLALTFLFAAGGLLLMLRGGGDIRQRVRAEPLIGMLALTSAYLTFSAPSDYLWHLIYGLDITAWSLPHFFLVSGSALVMLASAALLLAQAPRGPWRGLRELRIPEVLAIIAIAGGLMTLTQAATTEWDDIARIGDPNFPASFWARPEWLYPVVVLSISVLFSSFALHATRRAGVATLVMLAALGLRALLLALAGIWGPTGMRPNAHLLMLLPAVALDAWYALRLRQPESDATLIGGSLVAGVFFMIAGLPSIAALLVYPRINAQTAPAMVIYGALAAVWFGWLGARFGSWMGRLGERGDTAAAVNPRMIWIGAGALAIVAILTVTYMLSARPPAF